jgi:uncharacterized protein (TIGR02302 family)
MEPNVETRQARKTDAAPAGPAVRFAAGAALFWERLWPLITPALCILLAYLAVSWLGLWRIAPDVLRFAGLGAFAIAGLWSLSFLRELRFPDHAEITRRIEVASKLQHRPITAQEDELAMGGGDGLATALWLEHRRRMAENLSNLTSGVPAPDGNRKDPWALRAMLAVIAFVAFGFSFGTNGGSVFDSAQVPISRDEVLSRLDVWIDPPAYTRKPPVYLTGVTTTVTGAGIVVPQASELTLRYVGEGTINAQFSAGGEVTDIPQETGDDGDPAAAGNGLQLKYALDRSGEIIVRSGSDHIASWNVEIVPDSPPTISFVDPPTSALSGSLQLSYEVTDDYGVTDAETEFRSLFETDPDARPLVDPPAAALALPRRRAKSGTAKVNRDLTAHPWAGSDVAITLVARDDAGQTGRSETRHMVLPGRSFTNPLALALIEQRRILALDARKSAKVADMLDAVLTAPEAFIDNVPAYLALNVAWRRIVAATDDDTLRSAMDLLWETALAIEYGDLSEAERKLRDAQERLSEALENGATDEEIAELMEELRKAMDEFMRQLAQEALQNPLSENPFENNDMTQMLRQRDLDRMLDQIENLARSGSRDQARQLLSELQRMMDNLRAGRHMQQRRAEGNQMNQALDQLSELMRQQQELMDETFRMQQQNQEQQGQNGQPGDQNMTPEELRQALEQLRQRQQELREQLEGLGEQLEALGLDPSQEFGEAGREMGEAGENLGQGNPGGATVDQGQALEALRRGAQSMMQQMAGDRQQGGQQMGQGQNGGLDRQRSDPLGRTRQAEGLENGDETKVPDEIDAQRAREIMEAIRERLAEPGSPLIERNYLERLLDTQ